jgi:ABC-type polysaccharide/polyol phosphate export permease
MRLILALMRRDLRIARSHRGALVVDLVSVSASAAVFYFIGESVRGKTEFFAFAAAGLVVLRLHTAIPMMLEATRLEIGSGTFELLASSRWRITTVATGLVAFELARAVALAVAMLVIGVTVFGAPAPHTPAGVMAVAAGLAGGVLVFGGLAFLIGGLLMVMQRARALASLSGMVMPLLAGAYFPVRTLPAPLEGIATALPFRRVVDVTRDGLLDHGAAPGTIALLVAQAVLLGACGLLAFAAGVRHAMTAGTLSTD